MTPPTHTYYTGTEGPLQASDAPRGDQPPSASPADTKDEPPAKQPVGNTQEDDPRQTATTGRESLTRRVKKPADFSYEDKRNSRPLEELRPFPGERACHSHLLVGQSTIPGVDGDGLFLGGSRTIPEGKVLGLYTGERFPDKERALEYGRLHGTANKVFEMPTSRFKMKFVVARPDEFPAALINDPLVHGAANVEIRTNLATGKNEVTALRDIRPGEELLMEYGPSCWDGLWELAAVGDILGAYPELTDSYKAWRLQVMYDAGIEVSDDFFDDEDPLVRDSDDMGEEEDEREDVPEDEALSTPPSGGSQQSMEPQAPPKSSAGNTLSSTSRDGLLARAGLVSAVGTPYALASEESPPATLGGQHPSTATAPSPPPWPVRSWVSTP